MLDRKISLWVLLALPACVGVIEDPADRGEPGSSSSAPGSAEAGFAASSQSASARLVALEYENSIRDLFPWVSLSGELPTDSTVGGFASNSEHPVTDTELIAFQQLAEHIARQATSDLSRLLAPCAISTEGEDACAQAFMERTARRMYRRTLDEADRAILWDKLYQPFKAQYGFVVALSSLLEYLLQSPHFLYHLELVGEPDQPELDGFALAARMASFLWRSLPDETLLDAAESGVLDTAEGRALHAERMLDDERAKPVIRDFHEQWLGLRRLYQSEKDPTSFAVYGPSVRDALLIETGTFASHVALSSSGSLSELLTARYTYADPILAGLYALPVPAGPGFSRVDFPAGSRRAGILTQPSFLAANAGPVEPSIVQRGLRIRLGLLCQEVPPPPPGVDMTEGISRLDTEPCATCHRQMDLIGQGFDAFDAIGRETTVGSEPVFELIGSGELDAVYTSPLELGQALGSSAHVGECYARQWFRYFSGRRDSEEDQPLVSAAAEELARGSIRSMLLRMIAHASLKQRVPETVPACESGER